MRKRDSESSLDYIVKKIRKLEREVKRVRRTTNSSPGTSSSSCSSPCSSKPATLNSEENLICSREESSSAVPPVINMELIQIDLTNSMEASPLFCQEKCISNTKVLDVLGKDPSITFEHGPNINQDVAIRFSYIATSGLGKDDRRDLLKKYQVPENCRNIAAPQLNAELEAVFNNKALKREKVIKGRQQQVAAGIAGLSRVISELLCARNQNYDLVKKLMDVGRIFCDVQYNQSRVRRSFALYSVNKDLKGHLASSKIDKFLFGSNLAESLKTAKAVSKSSSDLKPHPPKIPRVSTSVNTSYKNSSWKARARYQRQQKDPSPGRPLPAPQNVLRRETSSQKYSRRPKHTRNR